MTSIGYATLQLIPVLKGVSEAIDKQLDGQVIEVNVKPTVDQPAAKKAGKDAGDAIAKEAKDAVRKGEIGKAVADDLTTSVKKAAPGKDIAKVVTEDVKKSSPGKDIAKVIVEGLGEGLKQGLPGGSTGGVLVDSLVVEVNKSIDSTKFGTKIVSSISNAIKSGNLAGSIKDAVLPSISNLGTEITSAASKWSQGIAASLRSGDIRGATAEIANSVTGVTNTIAGIGDVLGVKTDGVKTWSDEVTNAIKHVGDTAGETHTQVSNVITPLKTFGDLAGPESKVFKASSKLPLIGAIIEGIPALRDANTQLEAIVTKYTGLNVPLSGESWLRFLMKSDVNDALNKKLSEAQAAAAAAAGADNSSPPANSAPGRLTTRRAGGGLLTGPGTGVSDSILMRGSNGEYVVNADATRKNLPLLEIINSGKLPGYSGGGLVTGDQQLRQIIMERFGINNIGGYRPADKYGEHSTGRALDVMVGSDKSKGDAVKDFALANASAIDLKWAIWRQHLYYPGGGGYDMPDRGSPTQNHMDHVHIFSGAGITNGLRGALAGGGAATAGATAKGAASAAGPGAEDTSASDQTAAPSSSGSGGIGPLPSSISGLAGFGLDSLGSGIGTTSTGKDLSVFGKAAGSAVSGQVSSALGVLGIPDAPPILQAASQLINGISVGGKGLLSFGSPGSAGPLAGKPLAGRPGGIVGDPMQNLQGRTPGEGNVTNWYVQTARVEDAFMQAQQKEREAAAARIQRF